MTKKKSDGFIQICDTRRMVEGKSVPAYRVKSIGRNGEILQVSEILNDRKAVNTHINAMAKLYANFGVVLEDPKVLDETKLKTFTKK